MSKSTVTARVTIGWSNSFVIEASLETLAALRSSKPIESGYVNNESVYYLTDRQIVIEIIDAAPTMTVTDYQSIREAEKLAKGEAV